jgi:hypothetical protein
LITHIHHLQPPKSSNLKFNPLDHIMLRLETRQFLWLAPFLVFRLDPKRLLPRALPLQLEVGG